LQDFSSSGQFDNASLYNGQGVYERQLTYDNGSPGAPSGLIIPYSVQNSTLTEDSVALSFNNSISPVDDVEHWFNDSAFSNLSWIGVAYNASATPINTVSKPILARAYPIDHLDYHLINDTAMYVASNPFDVAVSPPVGFGFISYGLALDVEYDPSNTTLRNIATGYWNFYYNAYNSQSTSTAYARSINLLALAGFELYGCNATVENFTRNFIGNTSGASIEEYSWGIAALYKLESCTNLPSDISLYEKFVGSLRSTDSNFVILDSLIRPGVNNLDESYLFQYGETATGLLLGEVPFNDPIVLRAMDAVYQSNVNGTLLTKPYSGDLANTEGVPAYMLSTFLFQQEMSNVTGYWISALSDANITSITYSNNVLIISANASANGVVTISNATGSAEYPINGSDVSLSFVLPKTESSTNETSQENPSQSTNFTTATSSTTASTTTTASSSTSGVYQLTIVQLVELFLGGIIAGALIAGAYFYRRKETE
jgi:hypothetical protein